MEQLASSGSELVSLGDNGEVNTWQPGSSVTSVDLLALAGAEPTELAAGSDAMFLLADGAFFAWGDNTNGQLGTGTTDSETTPALSVNFWPTQVRFGETEAEEVTPQSPGIVDASTPAHEAETVDVTVTQALRVGETPGKSFMNQALEEAFNYEAQTQRPTLKPMNAPRNGGTQTWCDQNPDTFYLLTTSTPALGAAVARNVEFNVVLGKYTIEESASGTEIIPKGTVINQSVTVDAGAPTYRIRGDKSAGVNALGVASDGKAYFVLQYVCRNHILGSPANGRQYIDVYAKDLGNDLPLEKVVNRYEINGSEQTAGSWGTPFVSGGAVNPVDQRFYFSSYEQNGNFTKVTIWRVYTKDEPGKPRGTVEQLRPFRALGYPNGTSGDIAFDAEGNLLLVIGSADKAILGTIPAAQLTTGIEQVDIAVSREVDYPNTGEGPAGIAYNPRGYLAWQTDKKLSAPLPTGTGQLLQLRNPVSQSIAVEGLFAMSGSPRDLGSCATPPTVEIQKHIANRIGTSDQFEFGGGLGVQGATSAITVGNESGVQNERVGPLPVLLTGNASLSIGETLTPSSVTNHLDPYQPTLTCENEANNEEIITREPLLPQTNGSHGIANIDLQDATEESGSRGPRILCTLYNDPTAPIKTAKPVSGTHINPDETVDYTLTFENPSAQEGIRSPVDWYVDYTDYLGDVLDDADLVVTDSDGNNTTKYFGGGSNITPLPSGDDPGGALPILEYNDDAQTLRIRGLVEVGKTYTVTFTVKAKANDVESAVRRAGEVVPVGWTVRGVS